THHSNAVVGDDTDLTNRDINDSGDLHECSALAPLRRVGTQLGEPAIVRAGAGEAELRIEVSGQTETDTERRARPALDSVGIREDDLRGDAVVVHLLVAALRFPATFETLLV